MVALNYHHKILFRFINDSHTKHAKSIIHIIFYVPIAKSFNLLSPSFDLCFNLHMS
ncbi:hypothetical protein [Plasmodium yoelii yoelii]|uniref:Uncharacterized protein n=1 Tax=Plasmodium yoelii yoelii TaxID=73239 RepID=Q7RJH4_PLAYO|nr:hypothetical protein [Plasmodium yoelii yoelii]